MTTLCLLILGQVAARPEPPKNDAEKEVETIRKVLNAGDFEMMLRLASRGSEVFSPFETMLLDPSTKSTHVKRILTLLNGMKGDRSRFIDPALSFLDDPSANVRRAAVTLLGSIGGHQHAQSIIVLLSDSDLVVAHWAALSLVKIGDAMTLRAMTIWLTIGADKDYTPEQRAEHAVLLKHVAKCRDDLKARLEKEKPKK